MNSDIRVFVVEDDQDLRESVVEYLNLAGLTACGVSNAVECYHTLHSDDWCVAVVGIGLPDQSGYVLVEYIRTNTAMRVIILTARDSIDDRVKGYDSGADIYLVKPVDCREYDIGFRTSAVIYGGLHHHQRGWSLVRQRCGGCVYCQPAGNIGLYLSRIVFSIK